MEGEKETVTFDRIMGDDYVVIKGSMDGGTGDYQARMIAENQLEHFLECSVKQVDSRMEYRYRITSMRSLEQVIERTSFRAETIRRLIVSLYQAVHQLEAYLLSEEKILLHPRFIYLDGVFVYFCYYPEKTEGFTESIKELLPYVLKKTDHGDKEAIILAYSLYQVSLEERITMEDLYRTLDSPILREEAESKTQEKDEEKADPASMKETEEKLRKSEPASQKREEMQAEETEPGKPIKMSGERETLRKREEERTEQPREKQRLSSEPKSQAKRTTRKRNIKEILVPLFSAVLVFVWFGYHYLRGEFPWMENPELYTGIILLIIASNMVYVFGNTFQAVEEERRKRKQEEKTENGRSEKKSASSQSAKHKPEGQRQKTCVRKPVTMVKTKETEETQEQHKYALLSCQPDKIPNIPVSHFPFVIGKKAGECDFQIMDASIRKKHAEIERDREDIYVTDYSCGATFVDGHILEEKESMQIFPGQEIRFSDFSFIWADQKKL